MRPQRLGESRQAALDSLTALSKSLGDGGGLAFLLEQSSSPSRARLQQAISEKCPNARWHVYEPVDLDLPRQAASLAYGAPAQPFYKLDEARVILSLDCDFIGSEENASNHIRRFAKGRHLDGKDDSMSRLYAVESLFTLTGANSDHRLRVPPSMIVPVLARLAVNILASSAIGPQLQELSAPAQAHDSWIIPCARDTQSQSRKEPGHGRLPFAARRAFACYRDE